MKIVFAGGFCGRFKLGLKQLAENEGLAAIFVPVRNLAWAIVSVRNFLKPKAQYRAPVPVISVGNITLGGTGKTPFVKWLVRRLAELGFKPAVLTPLSENADEVKEHKVETSSEPVSCFVLPGRDRVASVKRAVEQGAKVAVLDDGFQYRSLHRDVDIVLWDATSQLSPNNPLLREPLIGLRRATCIVMSKADALNEDERTKLKRHLEKLSGQRKVVAAFGYEPGGVELVAGKRLVGIEDFRSSKVLLVAGIANPSYFLLTTKRAGFKAVALVCFPDHHRYSLSDVKLIAELAKSEGVDFVLTTRKDAVKLRELWRDEIPLLALDVKLCWIWGEHELWEIVERSIRGKVQPNP